VSNSTAYVDGRDLQWSSGSSVGDSSGATGLSVGGWGGSKYLLGEVQEVSIYQRGLSQAEILDNIFADQSGQPKLVGYFKLGYSTNATDELKNFAPNPAPSITNLTSNGAVTFDQTDAGGEQSAFDAHRTEEEMHWRRFPVLSIGIKRHFQGPHPGIAFDFHFGYSSANSFGGYLLGSADPYASGPLGAGWRQTFETRLVQYMDFDPSGKLSSIGLMNWNGAIDTWDAPVTGTNNFGVKIYGTNYFSSRQAISRRTRRKS